MKRSDRWIRENTYLFGDLRRTRDSDKGNFSIYGVPGAGKTTCMLIFLDSILRHIPDSLDVMNMFLFDPKNDFQRALLSMNSSLRVILTNVMDNRAWGWNMHLDVKDPVDAAAMGAAILDDDRTGGTNKFYDESPRHRFSSCLREFVRLGAPWSLRQAYLIANSDFYARQLYEQSSDPLVRDALKFMSVNAKETADNITMSLTSKLQNLATYAALVDNVPANRRYSLRKMIRNDVLVHLGGDFKYAHILGPVHAMLLKLLKNELVSQENVDEPGLESRRHWVVADEFEKLNMDRPVDGFADFLELGRSKGLRTCIVLHSPQQLVKLYGKEGADVIMGLCQHKLIFRMGDYAGADYLANYLGWRHGYEWTSNSSVSTTSGPSPSSTRSSGVTESRIDRRIVHPDMLMDLPLGDWKDGLHYVGISPTTKGTLRWRGHIRPDFLREHVVAPDVSVPSYEQCRRPAEDQYLRPLNPAELRPFGLQFDPNGYRP